MSTHVTGSAPVWSTAAIAGLLDASNCPVCGSRGLENGWCPGCGADLTGRAGAHLWDASRAAAATLQHRQQALDAIPRLTRPPSNPAAGVPVPLIGPPPVAGIAAPAPAGSGPSAPAGSGPSAPPPAGRPPAGPSDPSPSSSATLQSVLAVAGAGLVAIAALVFSFLTPDLRDTATRDLVVAAVTVVFLFGARLLARRGLRFSAEAVAALAVLFLALDVLAFTRVVTAADPWVAAAIGTAISGALMLGLAVTSSVRVWSWAALVALALAPAMAAVPGPGVLPALGWMATAVAAFALIDLASRIAPRVGGRTAAEQWTLTVVQVAAAVAAVVGAAAGAGAWPSAARALTVAAAFASVAALALASARIPSRTAAHPARGMWSLGAGAAGTAAFAVLPFALEQLWYPWLAALLPAAAVIGLIVCAALIRPVRGIDRSILAAGGVVVLTLTLGPAGVQSLAMFAEALLPTASAAQPTGFAAVLGLTAVGVGLLGYSRVPSAPLAWLGDAGVWLLGAAAVALVSVPEIPLVARIALALTFSAGVGLALPRVRGLRLGLRAPLTLGVHLLPVIAVAFSWQDAVLVVPVGVAAIVAIGIAAGTIPASARYAHVAAGYAYALVLIAQGAVQLGATPVATLCLTTSAAAVAAIVATFVTRIGVREWYAVLVVTMVPFAIGIAQVVIERSGWTALSTALIFSLALTLVVTERPGLNRNVRALAAALLVPSLAVVVVCLGAQILATSGSPVVLPVIATIVAIVLASGRGIEIALGRRIGTAEARLARLAIEASTLLTGAITIVLALTRDAAGLWTTAQVLLILGVGAAGAGRWAGRGYGWWMSGAALTGALWSAWAALGVSAPEPYVLPPALVAATVGFALVASGRRGAVLYTVGVTGAILPLLGLLAVQGGTGRGPGLLISSWALVVLGAVFGRTSTAALRRARILRTPTLVLALVAASSAIVIATRAGLGLDVAAAQPVLVWCLTIGAVGAASAALSGRLLRGAAVPSLARWVYAPAALILAASAWPGIERDWFAIWTMWSLMLVYLAGMTWVSRRMLQGPTSLPPVLFLFALAFVTAVVAWSPRDLRVEWFSLPLGAFLLVAGALHLRRAPVGLGTPASWPGGFTGSWPLLGPGLLVALSASIVATFTDPLTWRAILVIALALAAILIGAGSKLAAPFLIGIVVLPVENAFAFLVQIGRGIASMPWWITLAAAGAVLLILAATYERRAGAPAGVAARLRDLR